ncbi:MAG TPA: response regulator [Burkholderiales bacterium]|jgi:CheY-like chemotaxis protein
MLKVKPEPQAAPEVLVIDDDAILRELVTDWLQDAGYRVRSAKSCRAWLEQFLPVKSPALIVTDMFMPGVCGAEAVSRLKKQHPNAALIAVSGHFGSGQGLSAEGAIAAGADRAFAKPVKRSEFLQAVAELLGTPAPH